MSGSDRHLGPEGDYGFSDADEIPEKYRQRAHHISHGRFAAADLLENRLADAGLQTGAGWCLALIDEISQMLRDSQREIQP